LEKISPRAPCPVEKPALLQAWRSLTFLHWRYDAAAIARALPKGLTVDTFDGSAWVGLVPFVLEGLQPYGFPALPWISEFAETNVRTYVQGPDGARGVWFFTLEADRLAAVMMARAWYHLPYRWADMNVKRTGLALEYSSRRKRSFGAGMSEIGIEIGDVLDTTELDHFLTARFRLYTAAKGRIAYAQIEHDPWPLRGGKVTKLNETLIESCGLTGPEGEPMVHFSEGIKVKAGALQWI